MRFAAKGLPEGVTFDAAKGVLGGVAPSVKGDYDIEVTAENAKGKAVRTIRLAVGDAICLTPPMGWNSWNIWGSRFTGEHARTAARALDESGLGDYGWAYVNLDDFWEMNNSPQNADRPELRGPARDADGNVLPNPSFPDMKGLTDYIHSLGFRAGLYSSPGPVTCGGCEGSYGHEMQDARRWAEWGFDYVKYDWCSYDAVIADVRGGKAWYDDDAWRDVRDEVKERPYRRMRDCLLAQDRDIVYSFCQYGMGKAWEWARDAGANCWRSWEDMKDSWPWMMKALQSRFLGAENYWKYAGPGCWIDPDMLIVGDQTSCGWTHPTFLTPNEQYTHVSLWAMLGAPLLIGCDLAKLDAFTRNLLMNDEVIAVSQDRLGKVARCVRRSDAESVWARPLADGNAAVALVNHYPFAREVRVEFSELGLGGEMWVKDLWRHTCEGRHYGKDRRVVIVVATELHRLAAVGVRHRHFRVAVGAGEHPHTEVEIGRLPRLKVNIHVSLIDKSLEGGGIHGVKGGVGIRGCLCPSGCEEAGCLDLRVGGPLNRGPSEKLMLVPRLRGGECLKPDWRALAPGVGPCDRRARVPPVGVCDGHRISGPLVVMDLLVLNRVGDPRLVIV